MQNIDAQMPDTPDEPQDEEEQRLLPSDTDITITAYEIFNNRDHTQDVTAVIFDLLEAVKIDQADIE